MEIIRVTSAQAVKAVLTGLAFSCAIANAQQTSDHKPASQPVTAQSFAAKAVTLGKAEIELGQLAIATSKDEDIQIFAHRMIEDHTAADTQLKTIATRENLQMPTELDAEHKALKQKLSELKGDQFDTAYSAAMATGHDDAVALFESASKSGSLPQDLREFAASTLPTLRKHEEMAHALHGEEEDTNESR